MEILIALFIFLTIITVVGHGLWLMLAWILRQFKEPSQQRAAWSGEISRCQNCNFELSQSTAFCGRCGWLQSGTVVELLKDLGATERQIERFHRLGKLDDWTYAELKAQIETEKLRLNSRHDAPPFQPVASVETPVASPPQPPISVTQSVAEKTAPPLRPSPASVVPASLVATEEEIVIEPTPSFLSSPEQPVSDTYAAQVSRPEPPISFALPLRSRKPFSEVLNSFMEESNIRWGEIVGGLLIIGCSTALVVSLWSEISRIPVVKFLIFTTVTAALFGVGLYMEHRWKLPTTSRGILTIATLLVPLNFLAIAAVSGGTLSPGALVIGSELVAPAVFLCLVYFAGKSAYALVAASAGCRSPWFVDWPIIDPPLRVARTFTRSVGRTREFSCGLLCCRGRLDAKKGACRSRDR